MRIIRYTSLITLVVLASCGGTTERKPTAESVAVECEEVVINYDSMLRVMEVRYDALCDQRREAFDERDAVRRAELLEANDKACTEFQDSLEWLMQVQR